MKFYPGLMPWHLDDMTPREAFELVQQMSDANARDNQEGG